MREVVACGGGDVVDGDGGALLFVIGKADWVSEAGVDDALEWVVGKAAEEGENADCGFEEEAGEAEVSCEVVESSSVERVGIGTILFIGGVGSALIALRFTRFGGEVEELGAGGFGAGVGGNADSDNSDSSDVDGGALEEVSAVTVINSIAVDGGEVDVPIVVSGDATVDVPADVELDDPFVAGGGIAVGVTTDVEVGGPTVPGSVGNVDAVDDTEDVIE